jgi:mono/diheme cytochrome c family protein
MAEEVERSSQRISAEDLRAVATYLKDRDPPPSEKPSAPVAASDPVMVAGKAIFSDSCAACHREDGRGIPQMFPALREAPTVTADDPLSLIRVVLDGAKSAATERAPTGPGMPSYAWQLSDGEIAAVLTYVRNAWGNAAGAVSKADVQSARAALNKLSD